MAQYTTREEVREILRQTDATTGTAADLEDDKLDLAITDASAEVDGYLSARYTVPFTPTYPPLVVSITRAIAAYLADLNYRQNVDYDTPLDPVYLRYQRAKDTLEKLSDGRMQLPDVDDGEPPTAEGLYINPYSGTMFTMDDFYLTTEGG